jgi:hypothetical protein
VSPDLLVDALSGHEDGLLAIAERLMEHYDAGYDVMGEAIIDAFADVQKLFQHVVEAAHMEGAAFEASRREEEMRDLKKKQAASPYEEDDQDQASAIPPSPSGPVRHDEFIDQDVKDRLLEAIRQGAPFKEQQKYMECYELYEAACQSSSSLLPVDSDHRGRLQLSIARAESMHPDRACAILRYAMDDVLRSGLRAGKTLPPDISKRADVVLSKPKGHPSLSGSTGQAGVVQSSEEALASLVEEMKEILGAPVYKDTPLQDVAKRFWGALAEAQKQQFRNEERLEQNLGKLKGEFLLARAEWEEKLTHSHEQAEQFKKKYMSLKDGPGFLDDARNIAHRLAPDDDIHSAYAGSSRSTSRRGVESVASLGSGLAHHARSLVGSFTCAGINEHTGGVLASELAAERREDANRQRYDKNEWRDRRRSSSAPRGNNDGANVDQSRSFRDHSKIPQRVDV